MSKVMGIYVKFSKTTHQIWSCHVTLASNSTNFYFSPDFVLNFRKSYQIWGKLAQEQTSTVKNKLGGEKHSPPSAYRVKNGLHIVVTVAELACDYASKSILKLSIYPLQIFLVKHQYL